MKQLFKLLTFFAFIGMSISAHALHIRTPGAVSNGQSFESVKEASLQNPYEPYRNYDLTFRTMLAKGLTIVKKATCQVSVGGKIQVPYGNRRHLHTYRIKVATRENSTYGEYVDVECRRKKGKGKIAEMSFFLYTKPKEVLEKPETIPTPKNPNPKNPTKLLLKNFR